MKVIFKSAPPGVKNHIEAHLGQEAEVLNLKKWDHEKSPAMWLVKFKDTTMAWIKPQFLEVVNEELTPSPNRDKVP